MKVLIYNFQYIFYKIHIQYPSFNMLTLNLNKYCNNLNDLFIYENLNWGISIMSHD